MATTTVAQPESAFPWREVLEKLDDLHTRLRLVIRGAMKDESDPGSYIERAILPMALEAGGVAAELRYETEGMILVRPEAATGPRPLPDNVRPLRPVAPAGGESEGGER
jgi:hypothetical protein